jgi:hypothetical protein
MGYWHDVLEIRDIIDRYAVGVDRRDWELVRGCFVPECQADYGRSGSWTAREPFVAWLDEIHRDVGPTMHRITNHQIHVDDGTATATSYLDALLQVDHGGHDLLHVVGSYADELVRTDDGWKIGRRRCDTFLWRRGSRTTA